MVNLNITNISFGFRTGFDAFGDVMQPSALDGQKQQQKYGGIASKQAAPNKVLTGNLDSSLVSLVMSSSQSEPQHQRITATQVNIILLFIY